jgi:hypothetical protein
VDLAPLTSSGLNSRTNPQPQRVTVGNPLRGKVGASTCLLLATTAHNLLHPRISVARYYCGATGAFPLDYGCGHGDDLERLAALGIPCKAWDPTHRPDGRRAPSAVVNLGYVVNVIENPEERAAVLRDSWALAQSMLIVSARLQHELRGELLSQSVTLLLTARSRSTHLVRACLSTIFLILAA